MSTSELCWGDEADTLAWDQNDELMDTFIEKLTRKTTCRLVEAAAGETLGKRATLVPPITKGAYNFIYRIRVEDMPQDAIFRLPCPARVGYPDEKTLIEAATMKYIAANTAIPLAALVCHGKHEELGSFIIIQYVDHESNFSKILTIPDQPPDKTHRLDPEFPDNGLKLIYRRFATVLLQLSQLSFSKIGSLVETEGGSFTIGRRPLTHNMNGMNNLGHIPRAILPPPDKTFSSSDEWYTALAEMHIAQLLFQHNDAVSSEDDCRKKYVARQLFRSLARKGQLSAFGFAEDTWSAQSQTQESTPQCTRPPGSSDFRLWGDDLRPANMLADENQEIVAVIDWEYTYAAPAQFVLDPPWWLLLDEPESCVRGIDEWTEIYHTRLPTWLSAMEEAEASMEPSFLPFVLSKYMRESWETGRFWLNYAARKSWAFDVVYWKYLDERFFGKRDESITKEELWKARVHLLSESEREAMEPFVKWKMEDSKERILVDWEDQKAKDRLNELLFD